MVSHGRSSGFAPLPRRAALAAIRSAQARLWLAEDADEARPKLDKVTRAGLLMTLLGLLLTGGALVAMVLLLGKMVRRRAQDRPGPSRFAARPGGAGPLVDRDPPEDLPPGLPADEDRRL